VAIDKFTKWIEYKPIATHTADHVVTFICNILHRFGFPNTIITHLGSNFHWHQFWDFCERSSTEVKYVLVAHPRANGQVERANGWKCLKKVRLTPQDISSLTQPRKSDAVHCCSRPATCKEFIVTMIGTFNDALSMLEIWFFDESRMIPGYTSLIHGGKDFPLCTRL
jgi:hypothetical protein